LRFKINDFSDSSLSHQKVRVIHVQLNASEHVLHLIQVLLSSVDKVFAFFLLNLYQNNTIQL
jgi:hypothetical protein